MESEYGLLNDPEWLQARVNDGLSSADIADEVGCHRGTVCNWLVHHDINVPSSWKLQQESRVEKLNDIEWIESKLDDGWNVRDIADELDVSPDYASQWLTRHAIERPSEREASEPIDPADFPAWAKTGRPWQDEDNLRMAYWECYWSVREIAEWVEDELSSGTLLNEMNRKGIEMRSNKEAQRVKQLKQRGRPIAEIAAEVPPPWHEEDDEEDEVTWEMVT